MTRGAVERLLLKPLRNTLVGLVALTALAWAWLFAGAGMEHGATAALEPFPHRVPAGPAMDMDMAMPGWSAGEIAIAFSMWWVMMAAMMLPAAAPTVLLHARARAVRDPQAPTASGAFLGGYLLVWGIFSLAAALLQAWLAQAMLIAHETMGSADRLLSAGVLVAVGFYQLSPAKNACLRQCRDPAEFLSRHYRPGRRGALRMGVIHGAWCLGCCWLLMALLFVGGVMNLAWIALITLAVAAEKLLPAGPTIARVLGVLFLVWGALTLLE